jgi:hypothetical protein
MQASITIGGIEVAIVTSAGSPLEKVVTERYAPFLGAVVAPVYSLVLEANRSDDGLADRAPSSFDLSGTCVVSVAVNPLAVDNAMRLLFGTLAPQHDALLLRATGRLHEGGVHIFLGPSGTLMSPALTGPQPVVLIRRGRHAWLAASTPFPARYQGVDAPLEAELVRAWTIRNERKRVECCGEDLVGLITAHAFLPEGGHNAHVEALRLATDLVESVPFSELRLAAGPSLQVPDTFDLQRRR